MKKITYLLLFAIISNTAFAQSRNFIDQPYLETTVKVDTLVVPDQIFMSIYINEGEDRNKISLEKPILQKKTVRDYWVYVLNQYDGTTPSGLMVFNDGHFYVDNSASFRVPTVFDNLIYQEKIPP